MGLGDFLDHFQDYLIVTFSSYFCNIINFRILSYLMTKPNLNKDQSYNTMSTDLFQEIFRLFISEFAGLADSGSPYLTRRMKILENVAALRCSVIMVDTGCQDLVLDMAKTFFSAAK